MTKKPKYKQYTTNNKCPEGDATRKKKKNGGQKREVQGVLGTPGMLIQQKKKESIRTAFVSGGIYRVVAWIGHHLRWRPPGPLRTT
jgi:hypothetical protein